MANPLSNEKEIYEKIEKEELNIPLEVWKLMEHHINNDIYMINLIIGSTVLDGESLSEENAKKIINHTTAIKEFMDKLSKLVKRK